MGDLSLQVCPQRRPRFLLLSQEYTRGPAATTASEARANSEAAPSAQDTVSASSSEAGLTS